MTVVISCHTSQIDSCKHDIANHGMDPSAIQGGKTTDDQYDENKNRLADNERILTQI